MMQHLNGLLSPDAGKVYVDDVDISSKGAEAKKARNKVGMVFQYPEHQIFAETIFQDVAFGPRNKGLSEEEVEKQVKPLSFVGTVTIHLPIARRFNYQAIDSQSSHSRCCSDGSGLSTFLTSHQKQS